MAPSATSEFNKPITAKQQPEKHVHGAEDKTPLEAISQGSLIQPGEIESLWQWSQIFQAFFQNAGVLRENFYSLGHSWYSLWLSMTCQAEPRVLIPTSSVQPDYFPHTCSFIFKRHLLH